MYESWKGNDSMNTQSIDLAASAQDLATSYLTLHSWTIISLSDCYPES